MPAIRESRTVDGDTSGSPHEPPSIQSPFCTLDGLHHRARFVARLVVFTLRLRIRDDAGTGLDVRATPLDHDGSDIDAHIHVCLLYTSDAADERSSVDL